LRKDSIRWAIKKNGGVITAKDKKLYALSRFFLDYFYNYNSSFEDAKDFKEEINKYLNETINIFLKRGSFYFDGEKYLLNYRGYQIEPPENKNAVPFLLMLMGVPMENAASLIYLEELYSFMELYEPKGTPKVTVNMENFKGVVSSCAAKAVSTAQNTEEKNFYRALLNDFTVRILENKGSPIENTLLGYYSDKGRAISLDVANIGSLLGSIIKSEEVEKYLEHNWEKYEELNKQFLSFVYLCSKGTKSGKWTLKTFDVLLRAKKVNPYLLVPLKDQTGLFFTDGEGEIKGTFLTKKGTTFNLYSISQREPKKTKRKIL